MAVCQGVNSHAMAPAKEKAPVRQLGPGHHLSEQEPAVQAARPVGHQEEEWRRVPEAREEGQGGGSSHQGTCERQQTWSVMASLCQTASSHTRAMEVSNENLQVSVCEFLKAEHAPRSMWWAQQLAGGSREPL